MCVVVVHCDCLVGIVNDHEVHSGHVEKQQLDVLRFDWPVDLFLPKLSGTQLKNLSQGSGHEYHLSVEGIQNLHYVLDVVDFGLNDLLADVPHLQSILIGSNDVCLIHQHGYYLPIGKSVEGLDFVSRNQVLLEDVSIRHAAENVVRVGREEQIAHLNLHATELFKQELLFDVVEVVLSVFGAEYQQASFFIDLQQHNVSGLVDDFLYLNFAVEADDCHVDLAFAHSEEGLCLGTIFVSLDLLLVNHLLLQDHSLFPINQSQVSRLLEKIQHLFFSYGESEENGGLDENQRLHFLLHFVVIPSNQFSLSPQNVHHGLELYLNQATRIHRERAQPGHYGPFLEIE